MALVLILSVLYNVRTVCIAYVMLHVEYPIGPCPVTSDYIITLGSAPKYRLLHFRHAAPPFQAGL